MGKQLLGPLLFAGVIFSLMKAVNDNSVGWGSVGVCLMIYTMAWGLEGQLTRALDRLDDIGRALGSRIEDELDDEE